MDYEPFLSPSSKSYLERLPRYLQEFLATAPSRGGGLNRWTMRAAWRLHRADIEIPEPVMVELLEAYGRGEHRPGEVERAVKRSHPDSPAWTATGSTPAWPGLNLGEIERIAALGPGVRGLRSASAINGATLNAEDACDLLFPGNPLLCVGLNLSNCETLPREEWRGILSAQQFIVPSPMSATRGMSQDGRLSPRTNANTGPRKYLVVESDFREKDSEGADTPAGPMLRRLYEAGQSVDDVCASLHLHLARYWPLAMVIHSGGKSTHGWYPCAGRTEDEVLHFMRFAVTLGADPATWKRCQFLRVPGGLRRPGNVRQRIEYVGSNLLSLSHHE
jgi:hypothetical protein